MTRRNHPVKQKSQRHLLNYSNRPRFTSAVWHTFSDYSQRSTIHGIQYLGEKRRHWTERALWLIVFTVSMVLCGKLISEMHLRRMSAPGILSIADDSTTVANIPFPTVTICADQLTVEERTFNYSEVYQLLEMYHADNFTVPPALNLADIRRLNVLSTILNLCDEPNGLNGYLQQHDNERENNGTGKTYELTKKAILNLLNNETATTFCSLESDDNGVNCTDIFAQTLTESGYCYTFNYLDSAKMFVDNMAEDFPRLQPFQFRYAFESLSDQKTFNMTYPFKMPNAAAKLRFKVLVPKSFGSPYCVKMNGLKISVHSGDDMVRFDRLVYHVPFNHYGTLTITPNIVEADESLIENYDHNQRKCVVDTDRALIYFKKYTQSNCELDRIIDNWTRQRNCSFVWLPHFNGTTTCEHTDFADYVKYSNLKYNINLTDKCLPACDTISYGVHFNTHHYYDHEDYYIVAFKIGFSQQRYFSFRRSELYSLNSFISNCGGILSLFMGVSIMSIVEIFYSGTLRTFCNWRQKKTAEDDVRRSSDDGV